MITARSFRILDRLIDVMAALAPGGVRYYQDHVRTSKAVDYGPHEERCICANELLWACLGLSALRYREFRGGPEDHRSVYAQLIARNTSGHTQPRPTGRSSASDDRAHRRLLHVEAHRQRRFWDDRSQFSRNQ